MVRGVSVVGWYAVISGSLFLIGLGALYRLAWPVTLKSRFAAAAGIALAWPLALPMLSFASVAIARFIQDQPRRAKRRDDVPSVAPAA